MSLRGAVMVFWRSALFISLVPFLFKTQLFSCCKVANEWNSIGLFIIICFFLAIDKSTTTISLLFDAFLETIKTVVPWSVFLLHVCVHNPTGVGFIQTRYGCHCHWLDIWETRNNTHEYSYILIATHNLTDSQWVLASHEYLTHESESCMSLYSWESEY